ncbi:MAG: HlyC/CorC family transporter [Clostridia bacterium]|nr:HlyC/CorC family transporter [Clostridia bacterium]
MDGHLSSLLIMVACIIMSGYFSATETAFSSLNKTRIKTLAEKGNRRAVLVRDLSESYDKLISTILIGNNIVNIALASIGTVFFVKLVGPNGPTVSTVVITIVVLIFGEITPKSLAKDMPESFAMFSAPIIRLMIFLFTPINWLFSLWKKMLSGILKVPETEKMSQEELLMFVEEVQQDGSVDSQEGDLLKNAIEFTALSAEDILTHRTDIEAIPIDADKKEISRLFSESKFSRLPVYEESIDNIVGIIHLKDFYNENGITKKTISELMSPPLFVPMSEKIDDLLKVLQKHKSHIAIVLDEYGGTYGLITMEDILEELVGDIWDEHDEVVEEYKKVNDTTYLVDGSVNHDDFCEFFGVSTNSEIVSLGGWVAEQLGKIPELGDSFTFENLDISVKELDVHRASLIQVIIKNEENVTDKKKDPEDE